MSKYSDSEHIIEELRSRIKDLEIQNRQLSANYEKLIGNRARYLQMLDNLNDLVCEIDENGVFTYLNKQYKNIMGYDPSDLLGTKAVNLIHPDDLTQSVNRHNEIRNNKGSSVDIWRFRHKDGTYRVIESKGTVYHNSDNKLRTSVISRDVTEERHNIQVLNDKQEELTQVTDSIPVLIALVSNDLEYRFVNQGYEKYFGKKKAEIIGMKVIDLIGKDAFERARFRIEKALSGEPVTFENKIQNKEGEFRTVETRYTPFFEHQVVKGVISLVIDVTERKKTEDALSVSEANFRSLIENINAGVFKSTLAGEFITVNRVVAVMSGFDSPEDLINKEVSLLYANLKDSERLREGLMLHGEVKNMELQTRKKDGTLQWISINAVLLKDTNGVPESILGIVFDIAERRQIDEAVRRSEKKFRKLHESMMDGFIYVSLDGQILEFNSTYQKMLGYEPEELLQLSYATITPAKWHTFEQKIVDEQIIGKGYSEVYEKEYIRKDGSIFPVELRAFLIKDDDGKAIGIWGIARDITNRKRQESNLLNLNKQLVDLVSTKDKLFSIIAHDLRSPFDTILGFSELLSGNIKNTDPLVIEDHIRRIHSTTQQTHYLLENLLHWARTQTGQLDFQPEPIPLKTLTRQAINIVSSAARMKNISLENLVPANTSVYADKYMLQSILRNLLSNAIKYTGNGGMVSVSAADGKSGIEVVVEDNGIGMDEITRKSILIKNEFITTRGTAKEKGAGLGLTICKEFIQKNKGKIWVESQKGKGSRFYFLLPAAKG
ncbi:MAG: PAS domain-containing sensor histidine kinase [Bacteroidetes bacterium]|nr:PAS domain-containing sensor histidine kinase [Bacteroidota bacterium]